jgi:hypothetical protein
MNNFRPENPISKFITKLRLQFVLHRNLNDHMSSQNVNLFDAGTIAGGKNDYPNHNNNGLGLKKLNFLIGPDGGSVRRAA